MLMDNILELLGITDSNIKITRFSAESVNGEKRNVIEAREGITATGIARICHCSPLSVIRIIDEAVELKSRVARLPENLCFDEFRSVNSTMSFICSNCASGLVCGQNPFFESVLKFRFPVTKKPG